MTKSSINFIFKKQLIYSGVKTLILTVFAEYKYIFFGGGGRWCPSVDTALRNPPVTITVFPPSLAWLVHLLPCTTTEWKT